MPVESHEYIACFSAAAAHQYGKGMPSETSFGQDSDGLATDRARRHENKSAFGSAIYLDRAATRSAKVALQEYYSIRNAITVEISKRVVEIIRGCICRYYASTVDAIAPLSPSPKVRGNGTSQARGLRRSCYGRENEDAEAAETNCSVIGVL